MAAESPSAALMQVQWDVHTTSSAHWVMAEVVTVSSQLLQSDRLVRAIATGTTQFMAKSASKNVLTSAVQGVIAGRSRMDQPLAAEFPSVEPVPDQMPVQTIDSAQSRVATIFIREVCFTHCLSDQCVLYQFHIHHIIT